MTRPKFVFNGLKAIDFMAISSKTGQLIGESLVPVVSMENTGEDLHTSTLAIQDALDPLNGKLLLLTPEQTPLVDCETKRVKITSSRLKAELSLMQALPMPAGGLAALVADRVGQHSGIPASEIGVTFEPWARIPNFSSTCATFKFNHLKVEGPTQQNRTLSGKTSFLRFTGVDRSGGSAISSVLDQLDGMIFSSSTEYKEGRIDFDSGYLESEASNFFFTSGEPTLQTVAETLYNRTRYVLSRTGCTGFYMADGFSNGIHYEI